MDRAGGQSRVNYGMKDLFVLIVYVMMAVLIPQLMHAFFGRYKTGGMACGAPPGG